MTTSRRLEQMMEQYDPVERTEAIKDGNEFIGSLYVNGKLAWTVIRSTEEAAHKAAKAREPRNIEGV